MRDLSETATRVVQFCEGLRIAAQQGWAPGNASVVVVAPGVPPGSGSVLLSERDRRLAARHEERR